MDPFYQPEESFATGQPFAPAGEATEPSLPEPVVDNTASPGVVDVFDARRQAFSDSVSMLSSDFDQETDDDDIASSVGTIAFSDSSSVDDPSVLYGKEDWLTRVLTDPTGPDGLMARGQFDLDWSFGMTPRQRAEAVWSRQSTQSAAESFRQISTDLRAWREESRNARLNAIRSRRSST